MNNWNHVADQRLRLKMQEDYNAMKEEAQNKEYTFLHVVIDSYIREVIERVGVSSHSLNLEKLVDFYEKKQEPYFNSFTSRINGIQERSRTFDEYARLDKDDFKRRFLKRHLSLQSTTDSYMPTFTEAIKFDIKVLAERLEALNADDEQDEMRLAMLENVKSDLIVHRKDKEERLQLYNRLTHLANKKGSLVGDELDKVLSSAAANQDKRPNDQLYQMERFLRKCYEASQGRLPKKRGERPDSG